MSKKQSEIIEFDEEKLHIFASRVKELREERKISQEVLGKYFGCSRSTIGSYETAFRVPDFKILTAYSEFFDVSIDYLCGKTNVRKPLYQVACFSDITQEDFGKLSKGAQDDIRKFIGYVMDQEMQKKNNKK